ncbi:aldo/keto reductase [Streptomyces bauhiniae]|uniref:Aldo/keto reductase n=1 Tax=Streptomyces bauhiniae TaxID=2340725 RepID=A0A4Z1DBS7_9ACTN|nr:aldo/keto reductase [Streptomyces bauhiniae]TGN79425.1 aldo/keto reductase [Streptomyces bauhiniae]
MSLDSYTTLGNSGLRVSPFSLGTMTFGEGWGWGSSVADSEAILARYIERGGNFIDTANVYTNGHSEKILGDYVAGRSELRDRLVIATKFFCNLHPGDPNGGGASRKAIIAQAEQSLRRLKTDYIDLYWLHNFDKYTPVEETMRALDDLVTSGKVRYIGFSDIPAWATAQAHTIAQFRGWAPLIAIQLNYSLLERTPEGELIPMAERLGMGVTPWSPLAGGALSGKYTREDAGKADADRGWMVSGYLAEKTFDIVDELRGIASELDTTPAAVALAWVQNRPGVTSTIIGARRLTQLEDNLKALDLRLTPEQVAALDALSTPTLNFPANVNAGAPNLMHAGATVNGEPTTPIDFAQ